MGGGTSWQGNPLEGFVSQNLQSAYNQAITRSEFAALVVADANPQFFLNQIVPVTIISDTSLTPGISVPAYYAFANRRQVVYSNIQNSFEGFMLKLEKSVDISNQDEVVKYVYDHMIEVLTYDHKHTPYPSRRQHENQTTILGYFSDSKLTQSKGYATIIKYFLNRLDIPTIDQDGAMIVRDGDGDIVNR
jgi:hypothetical protein